jgi:hypothetical protein
MYCCRVGGWHGWQNIRLRVRRRPIGYHVPKSLFFYFTTDLVHILGVLNKTVTFFEVPRGIVISA